MGAVTVCGLSGGVSYTATRILTLGYSSNTWMIHQNGLDFGEKEYVDRFDLLIGRFMFINHLD